MCKSHATQSTHHVQHTEHSSRATHRALITCNTHCAHHVQHRALIMCNTQSAHHVQHRALIMCNTQSAHHVQHTEHSSCATHTPLIMCNMLCVTWYEGTAQLLRLEEFQSHYFSFILLARKADGLTMTPHITPSIGGRLGKQTC